MHATSSCPRYRDCQPPGSPNHHGHAGDWDSHKHTIMCERSPAPLCVTPCMCSQVARRPSCITLASCIPGLALFSYALCYLAVSCPDSCAFGHKSTSDCPLQLGAFTPSWAQSDPSHCIAPHTDICLCTSCSMAQGTKVQWLECCCLCSPTGVPPR